jgi:SNF2 family DNA or RNA helicase
VSVGSKAPAKLGLDAVLDFSVSVTLDGEPLSEAEWRAIRAGTEGLALVRGRWVEIDREKLEQVLEHWKKVQREVGRNGLGFLEGMRLISGANLEPASPLAEEPEREWSHVIAGDWLQKTLNGLRDPEALANGRTSLRGTLRPYQKVGVNWLRLVSSLGLGACLADDMGLGKTIQVLGLLLHLPGRSHLLVVPASLIANWMAELERFAPQLSVSVAEASQEAATDLVITTYGMLGRIPWVAQRQWDTVILDEAQAIKNPAAKQTRTCKALNSRVKLALTGTPVENRLGDLWSIFDFLNPGLLGSAKTFSSFSKKLASTGDYAPLRNLVRPYILRRLKTDKRVISDLPDKTELVAYCSLTRVQAALYQDSVDALKTQLQKVEGIERRGVILALLMRLKQICNHPSHWLRDGTWAPASSGKFARLSEICESIAAKQEKVLVFSQFREITEPLAAHLKSVFGQDGLVLHGDTPVKQRQKLVDRFQSDDEVPFFVLSIKAGGTGLNLTAASHVIHFDRWWNPAVENQATDRAFRIGQKKNVLVHKLVCRGTIEERIDELIEAKKGLSSEILEGGGEKLITEMADDEIIRLVSLDIHRAAAEG